MTAPDRAKRLAKRVFSYRTPFRLAFLSARRVALGLSIAAFTGNAQLVRDWHSIRTPHFEVISRYDPAKLGPLLLDLEWVYSVFGLNLGFKPRVDRRVLILIPDSPFEYEQINSLKYADGYYLSAAWRDMIVLRDLNANTRHGLIHEFTHLFLYQQGGRIPSWYNEGTAEYFSEMGSTPKGVVDGSHESRRIAVLNKGAWIPASYMMSLKTPTELNSVDAAYRYYAQSWLYVHMLRVSPNYAGRFEQFRSLLTQDVPTEEAIKNVYAKTLADFDEDAKRWFRLGQFPMERFRNPPKSKEQPTVTVISLFDFELAKAIAIAAGPRDTRSAVAYERLAKLAGDKCEYQAPIGDLSYAFGLFTEATLHYRRAIECGVDVPALAKLLASTIAYRQSVPTEKLEAVAAPSGGAQIKFRLGIERFDAKDYAASLAALTDLSGLPPDQRFRATRVIALSLSKLGRYAEALAESKKLVSLAQDAKERQSAELTLRDIEQSVPTEKLEAVAALTGGAQIKFRLGIERFDAKDYAASLAALTDLSGLPPDQRFYATRLIALSLSKLGRYAEALAESKKLVSSAQDAKERFSAELTLRDIAQSVPTEKLEAVAALTGSARIKFRLGIERFDAKDYAASLAALTDLSGLPPDQRFRATRVIALSLSKLGRYAEALAESEKLVSSAQDVDERHSAEFTLRDIEREKRNSESPPLQYHEVLLSKLQRLDGDVIRVDCLGQRARFWVQVGSQTIKLLIADPSEVISGGRDAPQLEFSCGTQRRAVTIGYTETIDPGSDSVGRIKYLVFR